MDLENATLLRECTSKIVASYVGRHIIAMEQIPVVITTVFNSLADVSKAPTIEQPREPAVPIRKSVRPDSLICLDCGFRGKLLKRHIRTEHGLTPETYREKWNLPFDYPLVAPNYGHERSMLAKQIGLGLKGRARTATIAPQPEPAPMPAPVARRRGRPRRTAAATT